MLACERIRDERAGLHFFDGVSWRGHDPHSKACIWCHLRHGDNLSALVANENRLTSGQPTEGQLAEIHALGVRHVVNLGLHTHEKAVPDEAACVARLGMSDVHIPVDFQHPTEQDFQQFCSVMERLQDLPVHVHCIANYCVWAFLYRYRRDVLNMDEARARAEMEAIWQPEGVWEAFVGGGQ